MEVVFRYLTFVACGLTVGCMAVSAWQDYKENERRANKWRDHMMKGLLAVITFFCTWGFTVL